MKLLTPQANKDLTARDQVRDLMRTQELEKAAAQARKRLADSETDFNTMLANNRSKWAQEELEHTQRLKEMNAEIDALEAKKLNALIPLGILKNGVYDRMQDATVFLSDLRMREERVDELTEMFEEKLDTVGKREQDIMTISTRIESQKEGIALQQQQTVDGIKALNKQLQEFTEYTKATQVALDADKARLAAWHEELDTKEQAQAQTKQTLQETTIKLADDRQVLQDAWDELRRREMRLSPQQKD